MPKFESPIIKLASGANAPAASGYAEGTILQPHPDDAAGESGVCVDVGGTKAWLSRMNYLNPDQDTDSTLGASRQVNVQVAPVLSRKMYLYKIEGWTNMTEATPASNYFTASISLMGATLASQSLQNQDVDKWVRLSLLIDSIVDMSALDNDVDAGLTRALRFKLTETGTQVISWAAGIAWKDIIE